VIGTVTLVVGFYVGMALSPLMTTTAASSGFAIPANATGITSVVDGFLYIPWVVIRLTQGLGLVGLLLVLAGVAALLLAWRRAPRAMERLAGADEPAPQAALPETVAPGRPLAGRP
jgi:galactitol PTS system EIIC component